MRFYLSLLLSMILSLFVLSSVFAMERDEEIAENKAIIPITSLSPTRAIAPSLEEENLSDIRGFQSHYKTDITEDEWKKANQIITEAAQSATPYNDIISNWLSEYESACDEYFHLYKMLQRNLTKTLKKTDSKTLLKALFNYTVPFDHLCDNLRTISEQAKLDYDAFQAGILPIIQPTFNLYMQAYETLSSHITTSLGSLDYMKLRYNIPTHLFYKRDEKGFLVFCIHPTPNEKIDQKLYETYVPYANKRDKYFEHSLVFSLGSKNNTPIIETRSGYIFSKAQLNFDRKASAAISIEPYYGAEALHPFTKGTTISFIKEKDIPAIEHAFHTKQPVIISSSLQTSAPIPVSGEDTAKLREALSTKVMNSMADFLRELLGDQEYIFFPLLRPGMESLEGEYLFLNDIKAQLDLEEDKHIQPFLLEYLKASFPDQTSEEVLATYEQTLLEAYEDEEYAEEVRKQQEERTQKVATGAHYTKGKKGRKGKKSNKNLASPSLKTIEGLPQSEERARHNAKERAKKRLIQLQQAAKERTAPEKFRKFLRAVNIATQELARLNTPLRAELNKSSHGNIVVEGSKPITLVRPHGLRDTISKKNAKGILTGLINTYFEKIAEQKVD